MDRPIRIGTRGSPLALAQASLVAEALRARHGWEAAMVELVPVTTSGDRIQDRPLAEIGGKALWTKELDRCLAERRTDLSVHSMKDVETIRPGALIVAAMLERADPRDRLIGAATLGALKPQARVGTSSPRRRAQLLARRSDLRIGTLRGNVQTRLAKIGRGEYDATLLAAAGLDRLGLHSVGTVLDGLIPAPAQGAIGIEALTERPDMVELAATIDDPGTHACVAAERAFLAAIGGDCQSALAAHATVAGTGLRIEAEILAPDGSETCVGESEDPAELAARLLAAASPALRAMFAA